MQKYPKIVEKNGRRYFFRFSLHQRLQHIVLFTCVITLSLTGFPLKYFDQPWAAPIYKFFGGIHVAPTIHRTFGTILLCLFVYHTIYWVYLFYSRRILRLKKEGCLTFGNAVKEFLSQEMIPCKKDFYDLIDMFKYLLYITNRPPRYDRISWKEKFDYYAPYWGIPILGPAGFILWWRDEFSHILPGFAFNILYVMHTDEALLAALFLFFVHWYNVHYSPVKFPLGTVFITGYLTEADMIHEHYAEYERTMREEGLEDQIKPQHH